MTDNGWRFIRHASSHALYRCPCGRHTHKISFSGGTVLEETYATKEVRRCRRDNREAFDAA